MKIKYWRNFKENYPLVLGHTVVLVLGCFAAYVFFVSLIAIIQGMEDPYMQIIGLIVFMFTLIKILGWIGFGLLEEWAKKVYEAFRR